MNYNIILHSTTNCNYNCSYCNVIKDKKMLQKADFDAVLDFVQKNFTKIEKFKFFGGEPLLNWENIKYFIDNSKKYLENKYEIVTNTSLLDNEICLYFQKYFKIIFFSIDSENYFDFEKIFSLAKKYNLEKKLYFNLIIDPKNIENARKNFEKIYNSGFRGFNILPVYYTKTWEKSELENFSKMMKNILDLSFSDKNLRLYGFKDNSGEKPNLINTSLFINTDLKIYFSDFVSTFLGKKLEKELLLCDLKDLDLKNLEIDTKKFEKIISDFTKNIYNRVNGQEKLHKIMDYFSVYLTKKEWKI